MFGEQIVKGGIGTRTILKIVKGGIGTRTILKIVNMNQNYFLLYQYMI